MNHKPLALTLLLPLALHAQDNAADPALTIPEAPPTAPLLDDTTITSEPLPAPGAAEKNNDKSADPQTAAVDPADLRIGFVNFRRIMAAAPQREEINERLEREFGVERDALLQAQSELRSMERQLETLQHGDNYNDYERQVINKRRDVARRDSDYRDNINVRRNEEMAKLQKMIGDEIINLAKEARYDIILNDIGVFYVSERADLSPQVITRLQRKAEKP
ncbi:OmpH family outer membrane protein [Cardiobacterium hominis]|uniref:OmpH family outer membrane protein n=1 Tax=Cardiobacterium hominis TaxID=2718 RepID=UPI0028D8F62B|nr:OmpH family outer membrane protein [Cardiobacterium hominis]